MRLLCRYLVHTRSIKKSLLFGRVVLGAPRPTGCRSGTLSDYRNFKWMTNWPLIRIRFRFIHRRKCYCSRSHARTQLTFLRNVSHSGCTSTVSRKTDSIPLHLQNGRRTTDVSVIHSSLCKFPCLHHIIKTMNGVNPLRSEGQWHLTPFSIFIRDKFNLNLDWRISIE